MSVVNTPTYLDAQTYLTYDPDGYGPWEIQALGVYGRNDYKFFPATRETNIGTINQAARLTVYYDGQEQSGYETGFGALAVERSTETPVCAGSIPFSRPRSASLLTCSDNTSSANWSAIPEATPSTKATPLGWEASCNTEETPCSPGL